MLTAIQSYRRRWLQVRLVMHAVGMKGFHLHGRIVCDTGAAMYLLMIILASALDALKVMVLSIAAFKSRWLQLVLLRNTLIATCSPAGLGFGYHVDVLLFANADTTRVMEKEMVRVRVLFCHIRHG